MATRATSTTQGLRREPLQPFRLVWALLCNVKFALLLVGFAALACMAGVLLPQVPVPMRTNPAARSAWLELQHRDFGPLTYPMDRLDLFDIFQAPWFYALWALIIVAVTVCTVSRFRPTARAVHHPQLIVPDRYFETAHHRADFSHPGGAEAVEAALRRRRYSVRQTKAEGDSVYLFAQRYPWNTYGTFLSHLALLMLLIGGLFTVFGGFARTMVIAETGGAAPVFDTPGPDQMFIEVLDAFRGLDDEGNIVDYYSLLEVRRGSDTISCKTTVNDPCHAFGYRIHQAAWFNDLARLKITAPDGKIAYDQPLDFNNETTRVPYVIFKGPGGAVFHDGPLAQLGLESGASAGREDDVALSVLSAATQAEAGRDQPEPAGYLVGWRVIDGELRVVLSVAGLEPRQLNPGDEVEVAAGMIRYVGSTDIPAIQLDDMPGAPEAAVVQMVESSGTARLVISGIEDDVVEVAEGTEYAAEDGYTYRFDRRVEASGVDVRRDPGDAFIWLAVGMAMVGLGITFYVPRRRLWVKVTGERTYFAGIAERTTRLDRELRLMGAELGSTDAVRREDADE